MTFIVGLTGGIGSGKSTAGKFFSALGVDVIDVDLISKNIVKVGSSFYFKIVEYFGAKSLLKNKSLDRSYIRHEIFKFPKKKVWLERLLHPPVNEQVLKALSCSSSPYIILESPLLLETQQYKLVDRILLVDLQERLQILRVKKRDGTRSDVVGSIIKSQMPREEKVRFANDIIKNDSSVEKLKSNIEELLKKYLTFACEK